MNRNIGKKLKKLRLQHGLSQKEMSEKINLSQSTYNRFERGESKTWIHYIENICSVFGITQEHLIQDEKTDHGHKKDALSSEKYSDKISILYETLLSEKDKILTEKDKRIATLEEMVNHLTIQSGK